MVLRQNPTASSATRKGGAALSAAKGPRAPSGARGWECVVSAEGSPTLWRRRGRISPAPILRTGDR